MGLISEMLQNINVNSTEFERKEKYPLIKINKK